MTRPADMLMRVGARPYPCCGDFVAETMRMGASKRLPGVPAGAVQDVSRVFLIHSKAIVRIKQGTLTDVLRDLKDLDDERVNAALKRPSPWHTNADLLARVWVIKNGKAIAVFKLHGVTFWPGIFGYFYLAQVQGTVAMEDDLEPALREAGVVPVVLEGEGHHDL